MISGGEGKVEEQAEQNKLGFYRFLMKKQETIHISLTLGGTSEAQPSDKG